MYLRPMGPRFFCRAKSICMGLAKSTYASPVALPVPAHDQDVHGIEALEELEDVELPGVEEAAQANHGEHLLPEAAAGPTPKPGPIPPTMPGPKPMGFIIAVGSIAAAGTGQGG